MSFVEFIKRLFTGAPPPAAPADNSPGQGQNPCDPTAWPDGQVPAELAWECTDPTRNWIGVDLDGTLARWDHTSSLDRIGAPVPAMLTFVRRMADNGIRVKIFTARAGDPEQIPLIRRWLAKNGLPPLEITNVKDYHMERLYDDRGIQVEANTGRIITDLN